MNDNMIRKINFPDKEQALSFFELKKPEARDSCYNEIVSILGHYGQLSLWDKAHVLGIIRKKVIENMNNGGVKKK